MKNKKGQVAIFGIMLGITIIILALSLAIPGKKFIDDAMNDTQITSYTYEITNTTDPLGEPEIVTGDIENIGLNCSGSDLSLFTKGTCVVVDFGLFWFFGALILIGGGIIVAKIIFN
jgi:hypothetical protein